MDSIPQEILTKIFNYIRIYKDLIQCQQVCKHWRRPAETAMFSVKNLLPIMSEKQLIALCNYLEKYPSRKELIPALFVYFSNDQPSVHILERLVQLAFPPNVRRLLETAFDNDKIYQLMDDVVDNSETSFTRRLLVSGHHTSEWYSNFWLEFGEFISALKLQDVELGLSTTISVQEMLQESVHERTLSLSVTPELTIQKLEAVLNKCPVVNILQANIEAGSVSLPTSQEVDAWTYAYATTSELDSLSLRGKGVLYRPDMIEYFVGKYPNAREYIFGSCVDEFQDGQNNGDGSDDEDEQEEGEIRENDDNEQDGEVGEITSNLYRSLDALKELESYEIQIKLPPRVNLEDVVSRMQTEDKHIIIDYFNRTERLLQARSKPN